MKLLYTGATKPGDYQPEPSLSLGGYISSSSISNSIGNLFPDASLVQQDTYNVKCVALQNDSGSTITSINIWFDYDDNNDTSIYEVGLVSPGTDNCGPFFEKIHNSSQSPVSITWYQCNGFLNKLTATVTIPNNSYIGLWLRRTLKYASVACDQLNTDFTNNVDSSNVVVEVDITIISHP